MFNFFQDSKIIKELGIASVGLFALYTLYKVLTNDLPHISASLEKLSEVQGKTNVILEANTHVIANNTKVIEQYIKK